MSSVLSIYNFMQMHVDIHIIVTNFKVQSFKIVYTSMYIVYSTVDASHEFKYLVIDEANIIIGYTSALLIFSIIHRIYSKYAIIQNILSPEN